MKARWIRLAESMVCKTTVAWIAATALLWFSKLSSEEWTMLTGTIFMGKAWIEFKSGAAFGQGVTTPKKQVEEGE